MLVHKTFTESIYKKPYMKIFVYKRSIAGRNNIHNHDRSVRV